MRQNLQCLLVVLAIFALAVVTNACGGDSSPGQSDGIGDLVGDTTDADADVGGVLVSATAGGTVVSDDGSFTLEVPPGALAEDTTISIRRITPSELPESLNADAFGEPFYRLEPEGLQFSEPVRTQIVLEDQQPTDVAEVGVVSRTFFSWDADNGLEPLGEHFGTPDQTMLTVVDPEAGTVAVEASLSHFSYVVGGNGQFGSLRYKLLVGSPWPLRSHFTAWHEVSSQVNPENVSFWPAVIYMSAESPVIEDRPVADIEGVELEPGGSVDFTLGFSCLDTPGEGAIKVVSTWLPAGISPAATLTESPFDGGPSVFPPLDDDSTELVIGYWGREQLYWDRNEQRWAALASPRLSLRVGCVEKCNNEQLDPGEDCDPSTPAPYGCDESDPICTENCICVPESCGDGVYDESIELCDRTANPSGCETGTVCTPECDLCITELCGNETLDDGEECDPSQGTAPGHGCTGSAFPRCTSECTCAEAFCGNGVHDVSEEFCDQSAAPNNPTGCEDYPDSVCVECADCVRPCGNETLDDGEECDPSQGVAPGHGCTDPDRPRCTSECTCAEAFCGNGVHDVSEEFCDQSAAPDNPTGCEDVPDSVCVECADCVTPCGNETLDDGEACDPSQGVAPGHGCTDPARPRCTSECSCAEAFCGNGVHDVSEEFCDQSAAPGNPTGCESYPDSVCVECADCVRPCGNETLDDGEACDPSQGVAPGHGCTDPDRPRCTSECTCAEAFCGNGVHDVSEEFCDQSAAPGNPTGCEDVPDSICVECADCVTLCGNETLDDGEACDASQGTAPGHGCTDPARPRCTSECTCAQAFCGNGAHDVSEEFCDQSAAPDNPTGCEDVPDSVCLDCADCVTNPCGDGAVALDGTEVCDPESDPPTAGCSDLGYSDGSLGCTTDCHFDTSECTGTPTDSCGDGTVDAPLEICDPNAPRQRQCEDLGYSGGTLACDSDCAWDTSGCTGVPTGLCGNGRIDDGEECEPEAPLSTSCDDLLDSATGSLSCKTDCTFDLTECSDPCTAVGEDCLTDSREGFCLSDGTTEGICLPSCTEGTESEDCAVAEVCAIDPESGTGVCAPPSCTSFHSDECGPGMDCFAGADGEASDCVPHFRDGALGDGCATHADCSQGMFCDGTCFAPQCSSTQACEDKPDCILLDAEAPFGETEFGICAERCAPFEEGCGESEWCFPSLTGDDGLVDGLCVPSGEGTIPTGGDCTDDATGCQDGNTCITVDHDDICAAHCDMAVLDPDEPGFCSTDYACAELNDVPYGACYPGLCTPYTDDPDCSSDQWCYPSLLQSNVGQCSLAGDILDGGECDQLTPETSCAAELLCVGGTCGVMCDPEADRSATPPAPGTCLEGLGCQQVVTADAALDVGLCAPTCTPSHTGSSPACEEDEWCLYGALFGHEENYCSPSTLAEDEYLDELASCIEADLSEFQYCAQNSACLRVDIIGLPTELTCYDFCRTSEGPFDSAGHPDCRRPEAVCSQLFTSAEFGVCGPDE